MFDNLDNFWVGFSDELEKIGVIVKRIAKRALRKAPVGRARAVPGFKGPSGRGPLTLPGVTRGRRPLQAPKPAKPSVPASFGPDPVTPTPKPPPAPAPPKVSGGRAGAGAETLSRIGSRAQKRTGPLGSQMKRIGRKGLEAGAQMAPWMVMGRMQGGGQEQAVKRQGVYV